MKNWEKTIEILWDQEDKEVLIASLRGKFSSSVMENSFLAFLIAIGEGSHMVEMDLEKTKDGRIVGHYDNDIKRLFHEDSRVEEKLWMN